MLRGLTAIDPALVVFDQRTTGIAHFEKLALRRRISAVGRLFLDIVINHTGWGSVLQENHPEWFLFATTTNFCQPGPGETILGDLVELKHGDVALWDNLAEMPLDLVPSWLDGFRCDAGYKVPTGRTWQYIIARVAGTNFPKHFSARRAWQAPGSHRSDSHRRSMNGAYSDYSKTVLRVSVWISRSYFDKASVSAVLVHYSELTTMNSPRAPRPCLVFVA